MIKYFCIYKGSWKWKHEADPDSLRSIQCIVWHSCGQLLQPNMCEFSPCSLWRAMEKVMYFRVAKSSDLDLLCLSFGTKFLLHFSAITKYNHSSFHACAKWPHNLTCLFRGNKSALHLLKLIFGECFGVLHLYINHISFSQVN